MDIQVLIATMHQKNHNLYKKMNLQTPAIFGNQCNYNSILDITIDGHKTKWLNFQETGVGLNRNNALMRASADICILADDDMIFNNEYAELVKATFKKYNTADIIIFNIHEKPVKRFIIKRPFVVKWYNFMRFGAARIAFRRDMIIRNTISFNLLFGGGCKYQSGEDTIFLHDCLKKNLKIMAVPIYIATLKNNRQSTWFKGYDNQFFIDKGALLACCSPVFKYILSVYFAIKFKRETGFSCIDIFKLLVIGIRDYGKRGEKQSRES